MAFAKLKEIYAKLEAAVEPQATANSEKPCSDIDATFLPGNAESALLLLEERLTQRDERQAQRDAMLIEVLGQAVEVLGVPPNEKPIKKTWLTTAEFAQKAADDKLRLHLSERTVQKWCREQRLRYKELSVRGKHGEYRIPIEEYDRFAREGLLPAKNKR